nr:hypothetical protein [uncultured Halomonas sp.]
MYIISKGCTKNVVLILLCVSLSSCALSKNSSKVDLVSRFSDQYGYSKPVQKKSISAIELEAVGEYEYIDTLGNTPPKKTKVASFFKDGITNQIMTITEDDITFEMHLQRYANRMVKEYSFKAWETSSGKLIDISKVEGFEEILNNTIAGYSQAGDYALTKKLTPGYTTRCLADEILLGKTLYLASDFSSENPKNINITTQSKCQYIGTTSVSDREAAVFNENVSATASGPGLSGATEFSASGWRMIDIETGIIVQQEVLAKFYFNGAKLFAEKAGRRLLNGLK